MLADHLKVFPHVHVQYYALYKHIGIDTFTELSIKQVTLRNAPVNTPNFCSSKKINIEACHSKRESANFHSSLQIP